MTRLVLPHLARAPEDPVTKMEACGFTVRDPVYCVVTVCHTPVYTTTTPVPPATVDCTGSAPFRVCMIYMLDMKKKSTVSTALEWIIYTCVYKVHCHGYARLAARRTLDALQLVRGTQNCVRNAAREEPQGPRHGMNG